MGKINAERCALFQGAPDIDVTVLLLYDSIDRGKTKTCAFSDFFCGKEYWFKNSLYL